MNKILITGGAGFIGGHLTEELLKQGHRVIVLDDESAISSEKFNWLKEAENHKFSILEKAKLEELFKKNIDYVVHLAAETKIQMAIDDPEKCYSVNVMGTLNVLELSRKYNVKKVVVASTSAIYGMASPPHKENQEPDCLNPYAASKLCDEGLCRLYSNLYNLKTVCFRFFNVYGEKMPSRGFYAPVIAVFNRQKRNGEKMTITGDGEQRRDFIYVKDIVSGIVAALKLKDEMASGKVFNLGSGENYSVNQIAEMLGGEHTYVPERAGDARETLADIESVKDVFGWHPKMKLERWIEILNDNN